ncbi:hypothetical protein A4G18_00255 [Pasteurellaceae bacterium Pebbles2]|nr:hypothetical protein [Pasteurellaceae bacterium Pebbles2]
MTLFQTLKNGQTYLNTWVLHPKLGAIFPENRVIKATKFAQQLMPFIAVFAIVWQQFSSKGNLVAFSAAILTAVFALCIPFQGLYWLGKRAKTTLPAQSAVQYLHIFEQLRQQGVALPSIEPPNAEKLTYQDLAELLKKAAQHLPKSFWNEL